jgi:hypothetical protein
MGTIQEALNTNAFGLYYKNRIILPFQAYFFVVIINDDIITDFSSVSKGILKYEGNGFTDLYFLDYKNLKDSISKYENIKMILCEKEKDIFDFNNHIKLALYLEDKHKVRIEKIDSDILLVE